MNEIQDLLLNHFELLTTAESEKRTGRGRASSSAGGVYGIKKLRELILELAVCGKLVPQNRDDEPANVLINRILNERDKKIENDKLRTIASNAISDSEKYVVIPDNWQYCRLGNLAKFIDYRGKTPKKVDSGIPLITAKNVRFGFISREPKEYITESEYSSWMTRGFPQIGDMLFTTEAPLGNVAIIEITEKFALAQRVICFQLHIKSISRYLKIAIMSKVIQNELIEASTGMTATGIKSSKLKEIPIPIPPIEEQKRIVKKVDYLMLLCDELESCHNSTSRVHEKLVEHLLGALTQSKNSNDFHNNWKRISAYFEVLFITEESIDALKKAILQLAVMGKLVSQSSDDEPASELLKRIRAEKQRLIAGGKIKKEKLPLRIVGDEKQFELPKGWEWTTLSDTCQINPRNSIENDLLASFIPMTMIGTEFNSGHAQESRLWSEIKSGFTHFSEGDVGIAKITPCFENSKACVFSGLANEIGAGTTELHIVRPVKEMILPKYILAYLKSPEFLACGESKMTGTAGQKRLPKEFVESNPFPLPPFNEQCLIVKKIDELMSFCDDLKSRIINTNAFQKKISDVLVKQAIE